MKNEQIPQGWVAVTLDDIAIWGSGGTPSRKTPEFYNGSIPWIKTGELGPKTIKSAEEHITENAIEKSSAKVFPKGSVGIAMYGATIGKLIRYGVLMLQPIKHVPLPDRTISRSATNFFTISFFPKSKALSILAKVEHNQIYRKVSSKSGRYGYPLSTNNTASSPKSKNSSPNWTRASKA